MKEIGLRFQVSEEGAIGMAQALGQRYLAAGPFVPLIEMAHILKDRLRERAKKGQPEKLPDWLVRFVGLFDSEVQGQLFELGEIRQPSSAKAESELGWSQRSVEETLVDTVVSLQAVGALD